METGVEYWRSVKPASNIRCIGVYYVNFRDFAKHKKSPMPVNIGRKEDCMKKL
jgi:hypothetical protein